jgi:hypothetical protein
MAPMPRFVRLSNKPHFVCFRGTHIAPTVGNQQLLAEKRGTSSRFNAGG